MPQMAPISWLSLFIIFSLTFLFFNMVNYYNYTPMMNKKSKMNKILSHSFNWKW
nr:ATP synthase F0 subunit 8 [Alipumilio avispas]